MEDKIKEKIKVKVAIGITAYNDFELVDLLLSTIKKYTKYSKDEYGVIVCDDGSKRGFKLGLRDTVKRYKKYFNHIELIEHKDNQGITRSWNHLTRYYDSEYTVILNNDILVTPNWLTSIIYFLENNKVGGVSLPCWYFPANILPMIKGALDQYEIQIIDPITKKPKRNQPINYIEPDNNDKAGLVMCAAGMLFGFKTSLYKEIGGFDERSRQFYNEIDFFTSLTSKGLPSYTIPYPNCYHEWSHTFKNNKELKGSYQMSLDREFYIKKWGGDIRMDDLNNPHYKYMAKIIPSTIKWLTGSYNEDKDIVLVENEYVQTDKDIYDSANLKEYNKLKESLDA